MIVIENLIYLKFYLLIMVNKLPALAVLVASLAATPPTIIYMHSNNKHR